MTSFSVTVVIPAFNEAAAIRQTVRRVMDQQIAGLNVVLVDDGSSDETWLCMCSLVCEYDCITAIRLVRNFGQQAALLCGYEAATGDAVICLDADLQDPPELIPLMINEWRAGSEVVLAIRKERNGDRLLKRASAWLFYRLLRLVDKTVVPDVGDFRLLSQTALKSLLAMIDGDCLLRVAIGWIGLPTSHIYFNRTSRIAGNTKYRVRDMARLARMGLFSTKRGPVAFCNAFALVGMLAAVPLGWCGWAWPAAGCVIVPGMLYLAVIAEYNAKISRQIKGLPAYVVKERRAKAGERHD